jgi:hypothetical protein
MNLGRGLGDWNRGIRGISPGMHPHISDFDHLISYDLFDEFGAGIGILEAGIR